MMEIQYIKEIRKEKKVLRKLFLRLNKGVVVIMLKSAKLIALILSTAFMLVWCVLLLSLVPTIIFKVIDLIMVSIFFIYLIVKIVQEELEKSE